VKRLAGNTFAGARFVWWAAWSVAAVFMVAGVFLSALNFRNGVAGVFVEVLIGVVLLGLTTMGMVISARRPGNAVGWIITGAGASTVLSGFTENYAFHALFTDPGRLPGGEVMAWLSLWIFIPSLFAVPALLFLLFPDGRLIGRRWRVVLWLVIATTCAATVAAFLNPVRQPARCRVARRVPRSSRELRVAGDGGGFARVCRGHDHTP
jgi:hypothetical protein